MNRTLRLDRISLTNFRCFAELAVELHPELTVLVADNGRGKTAVLDAIGIALGLFVDTIAKTKQLHGFDRTDVRLVYQDGGTMTPALPTKFSADGEVSNHPLHWSRALNGYSLRARTTTQGAERLRHLAQHLGDEVRNFSATSSEAATPPTLPLVAFYGTGRLWSEHRLTENKKDPNKVGVGRMSGYTDCLSSSSSFKGVVAWYASMMNAARDPKSTALPGIKRPERLLSAVREAARVVLDPTGWSVLDWDFEQKEMVVEHPTQGRLPLSVLSDGIRTMIALVADVAYRCASLNPHLSEDAARLTPGILLIDEVDMHLHPRWQQTVVGLLSQAFPCLQMILSTHSPHVLSTVDKDSIRVIRLNSGEGILETPRMQTRGVESADVLATIMGVDPVPQVEQARWLSDYRAIIEDGNLDSTEARTLRSRLIDHFGSNHPLMLDCDRLIRFQSFKRRRAGQEEA